MKFRYIYKIISLSAAFISGGCAFNDLPLQAFIMGATSVAFIVADSKQ